MDFVQISADGWAFGVGGLAFVVPFVGLPVAFRNFMLKKFEAFLLAKEFYQKSKSIKLPHFLKDQLSRASSSIALNLAEGSGKRTPEDQRRFYSIAFGSLRECQAILELENIDDLELKNLIDRLGAMLFKLSIGKQTKNGTTNAKPPTPNAQPPILVD